MNDVLLPRNASQMINCGTVVEITPLASLDRNESLEAIDNLKRLHHHASLGILCGAAAMLSARQWEDPAVISSQAASLAKGIVRKDYEFMETPATANASNDKGREKMEKNEG